MTEDERKLAYVEQQLDSGRDDSHLKQLRRELRARLARRTTPVPTFEDAGVQYRDGVKIVNEDGPGPTIVMPDDRPAEIAARMAAAARKAVEG